MWGAAERERAVRWLTSRAALSVRCVRAVRVGLKRREGGSACWAAGAGEGEETGRAGERGWANAGFGVGAGWAARERARGGKGKSGPGWVEFGFGLGWGFPGFWASFPFSSSISFPF